MSVFKRPGHSDYSYDFRYKSQRFSGSTGCQTKREAQKVEARLKNDVKSNFVADALDLSFEAACGKYWNEVGQYHSNSNDTLRSLDWLMTELGKRRAISLIGSADVARLVATRRTDDVSPATVNRTVIEPLRAILKRAGDVWEHPVRRIDWRRQTLKEPTVRIRELSFDEELALFENLRPDYQPLYRFAMLYGCRRNELLNLTWRDIDWHEEEFTVVGKGDKTNIVPPTPGGIQLLKSLPHSDARVFTRWQRRLGDKTPDHLRVPIEKEALKTMHRSTMAKAKIRDFRFHDLRHTAGSRLQRNVGNLLLARDLLNHSDIKTTTRYAHSQRNDLRDALITTENATEAQRTKSKNMKKLDI